MIPNHYDNQQMYILYVYSTTLHKWLALYELNKLSIPSEVIFNLYIHYSALYLKEMSGSSQRQYLNPISEPEHKYKKITFTIYRDLLFG